MWSSRRHFAGEREKHGISQACVPHALDRLPSRRHKRLMPEQADIDELSFEDALKRLEAIVQQLEAGEVPLERSIALYAEGDRLRAQCEARLKSAQAKIDQIQLSPDGRPADLRPFDAA
jgi:exodeoxyribonuclease VII small subunit